MSLQTLNDALNLVEEIKHDLLIMTSKLSRIQRNSEYKMSCNQFEQELEVKTMKKIKTDHLEYDGQKNMFESPSKPAIKKLNFDNEPFIINVNYTSSHNKKISHPEFSFDNKENQDYQSDQLYSKENENIVEVEKSDDDIVLLEINPQRDKKEKKVNKINLENCSDDELNLSDGWISPHRLSIIIIEDSVKDENDKDSFLDDLDDSELEMDKYNIAGFDNSAINFRKN